LVNLGVDERLASIERILEEKDIEILEEKGDDIS
jgi:hypothetical protein